MELPGNVRHFPGDLSAPDTLRTGGREKFPEFRQTLSQGLSYLSFANLIAAAIAFSTGHADRPADFRAWKVWT